MERLLEDCKTHVQLTCMKIHGFKSFQSRPSQCSQEQGRRKAGVEHIFESLFGDGIVYSKCLLCMENNMDRAAHMPGLHVLTWTLFYMKF